MAKGIVSGGTGFVGRFIVEALLDRGDEIVVASRNSPPPAFFSRPVTFVRQDLDPDLDFQALFDEAEFFVHAAFDHLPGRYRGGEGGDPEHFRRRNETASIAMFRAARAAGVRRGIFLSSRAVYGTQHPRMQLDEESICRPDTLYGETKLVVEKAIRRMARPGFETVSLRITGVYGPAGASRAHKWSGLFDDYLAGRPITPRVGTEVHGDNVADAVARLLDLPAWRDPALNVSDIVVDRRDLLELVKRETGSPHPLPERVDASQLSAMAIELLQRIGWQPGGQAKLEDFLLSEIGALRTNRS